MTTPWIALIIGQSVLLLVLAMIQIGIIKRLLPILEWHRGVTPPAPATPAAGQALPEFTATLGDGMTINSGQMAGQPFLLLFVSQSCKSCHDLLARLDGNDVLTRGVPVFVVVDPARDSLARFTLPGGAIPLLESESSVSRSLRVGATPTAIAVSERAVITGSLMPDGPDDIDSLIQSATARPEPAEPAMSAQPHTQWRMR